MKIFTWIDSLMLRVIPEKLHKYTKIVRYIISGGSAAVVHLGFLYVFTVYLHLWYVLSTVLAFLIAFSVSYTMQKFWTYTDHSMEGWKSQVITYFAIVITTNVGLNALLLYLVVHYLHIYFMLGQIIVSILIAVMNYFVYQIYVFKKPKDVEQP